ncbi:class I lanthipeptide [Gynurincola endophyticus]|uniref:class I lanthipeptide n=1 Tax=Gynurincola endophyticus TaxID=2479004 RepID=UPI000F8E909E|nr:class I lanthipeptide [Gynurincola endophyticus]
MKKIKRLSVNKEIISRLNNNDMEVLKGGFAAATVGNGSDNKALNAFSITTTFPSVTITIIETTLTITVQPSPDPPGDCCGTVNR